MRTGVEYRTPERFQGKPVYVKAVDCGAMANMKVVTIVDDSKRLLDVIVKGNPALFPMVPVNTVFAELDGGFSCDGVSTITRYAGERLASSNHTAIAIAKFIDA